MTRREAIVKMGTAAGSAALLAREVSGQAATEKNGGPRAGEAKAPRTTPGVCGFSANMAKVPYASLGLIAQQIGYDGVDLTVMEGGHVNPHITNVDLVRAIESVRGAGLDVPLISTNVTSIRDQTAYPILAIAGRTDVHLYRTGFWPWGAGGNPQRRLAEVASDLTGLVAAGRQYQMVAMVPNHAGRFVGEAVWDAQLVLGNMDPALVGYYFDPSQTQAWEAALRLALPRLKAAAVQDFYWARTGGAWTMKTCPLGEGMVDWALFFQILAQAKFTGPLSLHCEYQAEDELSAQSKDLEFVRKQIQAAWA